MWKVTKQQRQRYQKGVRALEKGPFYYLRTTPRSARAVMTTILPTLIRVISRKSNRMEVGGLWVDGRARKPWDIGYVSFTVDYVGVKYLVFIHRFNRENVAVRLMQYVNHQRVQKYFTMFDIAKMPNIRKIGIHLVWAIKKGIFESVMEDQ